MLSLDTNILVYSADNTAAARYVAAKQIVDRAAPAGVVLTEQSLFEFFHACTRKGKMTLREASTVVERFARDFSLIFPHKSVVEDALALRDRYGVSIWDARLLVVCGANGCNHLLSEDMQDGMQYGPVTIVNPFKAANVALVGQLLK